MKVLSLELLNNPLWHAGHRKQNLKKIEPFEKYIGECCMLHKSTFSSSTRMSYLPKMKLKSEATTHKAG